LPPLGEKEELLKQKYERLLTRKEVADMLRVCPHTVRNLEKRGSLPRVEISGIGIRYLKEDVEDFISSRRVERAYW
tara:strand:+ start:55 stop:282 length:228 start_codon:yes stop_codon:yes gene_type:complete